MIRMGMTMLAALAASACQATPAQDGRTDVAPPAEPAVQTPEPEPAKARSVEHENDMYDFSYSYPVKAAAIPKLASYLEKDLKRSEDELRRETSEAKVEAEENDYPYRPFYLAVGWDVAADLPGWLSLGGSIETYSGGAHGNQGFDSLLWDKQAQVRREPTELFRSEAALRDAIRADFCDALDKERAERRGEPVSREDGMFSECVDPLEGTILLESTGGKVFDSISVLVAPYLAGPYAEGSYVIELPISYAVRAALKPQYTQIFPK